MRSRGWARLGAPRTGSPGRPLEWLVHYGKSTTGRGPATPCRRCWVSRHDPGTPPSQPSRLDGSVEGIPGPWTTEPPRGQHPGPIGPVFLARALGCYGEVVTSPLTHPDPDPAILCALRAPRGRRGNGKTSRWARRPVCGSGNERC